MKFLSKFNKESGFTLIETMAAIALFSVVALLASTFLLNTTENKNTIAEDINLQQKTNLLVSSIERNYHDGTGSGALSFRDPGSGIQIKQILVNGTEQPTEGPLSINYDAPLALDITTVNKSGKELTIQTTWRPHGASALSLNP